MGILRPSAHIALLVLTLGPARLEAESPLAVTDPVLYAIDANVARVTAMAVDAAGNLYLTGSTNSTAFPTTPGVVQPSFGGGSCFALGPIGSSTFPCYDAFVVKLDRKGKAIYATYLGGKGHDIGSAIAVDLAGNAYIAGSTGTNIPPNSFPTTPGAAFTTPNQGNVDGFVAKLTPSGTALVYSTLLPGAGWGGGGIAVDQSGAVYVAATANPGAGGTFPTTAGAFQTLSSGRGTEAVAAKLNAAGSALIYGTYLGGSAYVRGGSADFAGGIAVDASGNAYITGKTIALDFPVTAGALQTKFPNALGTAFVSKLNAAGTALIYSTYLGGTYGDSAHSGRIDAQGNAYILGSTSSKDFPTTPGALQPFGPNASWGTNYDRTSSFGAFVSILNAAATALSFSSYLQGASALDVDPLGNIYVAGQADRGFPVTAGADQRCMAGGGADVFVARFTPDGELAGATYLGGSGFESANAIAVAPDGSVYVAGTTGSTDFPGLSGNTAAQAVQFVARVQINDPQRQNGPCMALALQNAASFAEGPVAPGEMVTLRGAGFGPDTPAFEQIGPDGNLSTELAGVGVFFDDVPAPLLYVQSRQINAIAPWEIAGKAVTQVRVEFNGVSTNTASIPVVPAAPGIFHANFTSFQGAILNDDGTPNSPPHRAKRGTVVSILGTGGGLTSPMGVTGGFWPADPLAQLTLPVSVNIGGVDAEVVYAGAAPTLVSGFLQINVRVPEALAPNAAYPVELSIGGVTDRTLTTVSIE